MTPKNKKLWKDGEEVPLEYIEVGDRITFKTPDQPDRTGVVARLLDLREQDHLRKVAFLDHYSYVLNGYPDKVTTAHWTLSKEQKLLAEKVEKKKKSKQYKKFERAELGRVYGYGFSKTNSRIYVKVGDNKWAMIDTHTHGGFELYYVDDEFVYENVLDENAGNLITPLRPS